MAGCLDSHLLLREQRSLVTAIRQEETKIYKKFSSRPAVLLEGRISLPCIFFIQEYKKFVPSFPWTRKLIQDYNQCSAFPWMCLIHFQLKNNLVHYTNLSRVQICHISRFELYR